MYFLLRSRSRTASTSSPDSPSGPLNFRTVDQTRSKSNQTRIQRKTIIKLFVIMSFCFSVFLTFCLSVFLSFCLSVFLSVCLYVCMSVCLLSLCLYIFLSYCLSIFPSFCLSISGQSIRRGASSIKQESKEKQL